MITQLNFDDVTEFSSPWKLFYFNNILSAELLEEVSNQFNNIDWDAISEFDAAALESDWMSIAIEDKLQNILPIVYSKIKELFGVEFVDYSTSMTFKYDTPGHILQPLHRDNRRNLATFQIFIQEDSYPNGGTIMHTGPNDSDSSGIELPLDSNSATLFLNNTQSWHSVTQHGYYRKSILMRFNKK